MDADSSKRKGPPSGTSRNFKRKKSGNDGKWKTPHQARVKPLNIQRGNVEPGDVGVWVTCARGMEGKAARELQLLFDEYAEKLYGIQPPDDAWSAAASGPDPEGDGSAGGEEEPVEEDIESLVQREIASLKSNASSPSRIFTPVRLNVECLLFTKTRAPIVPVELAYRICRDAKQDAAASDDSRVVRTTKYLNRLTPITASGRSNEKGVEEVARNVLPQWFKMCTSQGGDDAAKDTVVDAEAKPAYSFAIRLSSRHHNQLKRDGVIRQIASLIDEGHHKVDLNKPDKVILVEIFKTTLGMSVVDGDWAELKKYNLSEIYNLPLKGKQPAKVGADAPETKPEAEGEKDAAAPLCDT
ncbi:thump domain containing protein [Grosmannia clavigera kw1407]|uniref:Thump domain containing protein n=1 Tax=Grosmannia clavigera (strain kw1407 / UAMH 11150) TaxID=655863 RepID=F0XNG8_GROCL|nr:thump domain containing protein [Grosmannia clavigera kw1407]EFX00822.1 thump domain containing protein [Grosmannia clavigera kw1407]